MLNKRRPLRLGTINPLNKPQEDIVEDKNIVEDKIKERRNRVIDLSKYNVGFDAVRNKEKRTEVPTPTKAQATQYDKYLHKLHKGELSKFSTRDLMFYFRDIANENGVKYIIANPKVEMRNFKLALDRGYTTENILAMIEFLFTSGQKYLDIRTLHPGILLTNWCNTIYRDTELWLNDEYNPNRTNSHKPNREWVDNNTEKKSSVGEWE